MDHFTEKPAKIYEMEFGRRLSPRLRRASVKDRQTEWGPHHGGLSNDACVATALWAGVDYGSFLGRTGFQRRRMSRNRLYGEGVAANMYVLQSTHMYTYAVRRDEI